MIQCYVVLNVFVVFGQEKIRGHMGKSDRIKHYLTCKLMYFILWFIKNFFISFSFSIKKHSWFEDDKILCLRYTDIFNGEWHIFFGLKKMGIKTRFSPHNRTTYINGLGGDMWKKLFNNWYVCYFRGSK